MINIQGRLNFLNNYLSTFIIKIINKNERYCSLFLLFSLESHLIFETVKVYDFKRFFLVTDFELIEENNTNN